MYFGNPLLINHYREKPVNQEFLLILHEELLFMKYMNPLDF